MLHESLSSDDYDYRYPLFRDDDFTLLLDGFYSEYIMKSIPNS